MVFFTHSFAVMKKWQKHISILFFICAGLFLMPAASYACSEKEEQTAAQSCLKDPSPKTIQEHCSDIQSHKKNKSHHTCNDNCKHNSCRCSTSSIATSLLMPVELKATHPFPSIKKQLFGYKQAYYATGYYSILQPPKIS